MNFLARISGLLRGLLHLIATCQQVGQNRDQGNVAAEGRRELFGSSSEEGPALVLRRVRLFRQATAKTEGTEGQPA
jgi:hypothetical protein